MLSTKALMLADVRIISKLKLEKEVGEIEYRGG